MTTVVVVPCFNEEQRLDLGRFEVLTCRHDLRLLFVDDGSHDRTVEMISGWSRGRPSVDLLALPVNAGKGEAVRAGMLHVVDSADSGVDMVAYLDADLASPPSELLRVIDLVRESDDVELAMGARVALLGTSIERSRLRHYQGRVFATLASLRLQLPVYDTQCGLKVIRNTAALRTAISEPFRSRWVFDIELIARMMHASPPLTASAIREVPLQEWSDVGGSNLSLASRMRALYDLVVVTR